MAVDASLEELVALNVNIAEWEQQRDAESVRKLDEVLSPALIFRRANGTVVDKETFMRALQDPSPFKRRVSDDVAVTIRDDRAIATLIVIGTKADNSIGRYRNERFFLHRDNRWQIVYWFNEDVTGAAEGL